MILRWLQYWKINVNKCAPLCICTLLFYASAAHAAEWFVSKNGDNSSGRSWAGAWNELDQIQWRWLKPGDIVYIDGGNGTKPMIYTTSTQPNARGQEGKPITITRSQEAGHNGTVVIAAPNKGDGVFLLRSDCDLHHLKFDGLDQKKFVMTGKNGASRAFSSWVSGSYDLHDIEIANMTITDFALGGIYLRDYSTGINLHHLEVRYSGPTGSSSHNIRCTNPNNARGNSLHHSLIHEAKGVNDNICGMSGFDIYNNAIYQGIEATSSSADNIFLTGSYDVNIYNNLIYADPSKRNQFIFASTGSKGEFNTRNIKIYNNIFWSSQPTANHFGVFLHSRNDSGGPALLSDVGIYNNVFYNIGYNIMVRTDQLCELKNIQIKNNIFMVGGERWPRGAIYLKGTNTLTGELNFDYNLYDTSSRIASRRGHKLFICWNGKPLTLPEVQSSPYNMEPHGIEANPMFVDPLNANFHLSRTSPAVNRGLNLSNTGFSDDKDGVKRPQNATWAMGAYEYMPVSTHYIRADAIDGDGSDWAKAWQKLPATLMRGHTYYIADGGYPAYTFDDPPAGTQYINIKKAAAGDHGTNEGWQADYGDGEAVFTAPIAFSTSYWVLDGQTGGGPDSWTDGYGFKISTTSQVNNIKLLRIKKDSSNIIVRHTDMVFEGDKGGATATDHDNFYTLGAADITLSYCAFRHAGRVAIFTQDSSRLTLEYCYLYRNKENPDRHSEAIADSGSSDFIIRHNLFREIMGTGIIVVLSRGRFGISNNWEIYGNVFVGEGGRPYNCTDGSIAVINKQEANNWKIYNNSFVNLHGAFRQTGISFSESSGGGHEIYNNLWYNCEKVRYTYSGKGANDYSYFINCISYPIENHWQTGIQDPFVDPRNLNFSLRHATDPGKADLGLSYRTDPIGRIRGADSNWDRGAYEYMPPTSHGGFSSNNRALLYDAAGVAQYDTRAN